MIFITETGSTYETNLERTKVRRLEGMGAPTERIGTDWEWKDIDSISEPMLGKPVYIFWDPKTTKHISGTIPTTITSRVIDIKLDN